MRRTSTGEISIIIPVLSEGEIINDLIKHLRSLKGGGSVQIIVVDGDEKRSTLRAIRRSDVLKLTSKMGRGAQMNRGAERAGGEVLLFLHADTLLPEGAFDLIHKTVREDRFGAGAFNLRFDDIHPILKALTFTNDLRARITRTPYGDQAIFMKRDIFQQMGGYCDIMLFEDVDLIKRVRKKGLKIRILKQNVLTSGRRFNRGGPFRRLLRNLLIILMYNLGMDPDRLARYY